jgi:hypothetical protein
MTGVTYASRPRAVVILSSPGAALMLSEDVCLKA